MGVVKNIVVPEQYTVKGEEKTKWNNIGSIIEIEKDGKKYQKVKLNNVPIGWDGWAYLFDPKPYEGKKDNRKEYTQDEYDQSSNDMNSDNGGSQDVAPQDIDDKPIDLSEIPF